jgi:hypothetical protein
MLCFSHRNDIQYYIRPIHCCFHGRIIMIATEEHSNTNNLNIYYYPVKLLMNKDIAIVLMTP